MNHAELILLIIVPVFAVLVWLGVRHTNRERKASAAWDADFERPEVAAGRLNAEDGIYLGYACDRLEGDPPSQDHPLRYGGTNPDDRHLMTIGPNGSGKSMRLLYENLVRLRNWSIVVVDPKGDLARHTLETRRKAGSHIIVLDPFGVSDFKSDGFNPVAALNPASNDFPDDALALAEALIRQEGREPHWAASAQDLVCACMMAERLALGKKASLGGVRNIIGQDAAGFIGSIGDMIELARDEKRPWPELAVKAARYHRQTAATLAENRELNSILSTALTQTRWLDSRAITADLASETEHDFKLLKQKPTTVYLILPPSRLVTHSVWLRLMITSILTPLLKETGAKIPTLLMLDEYPALADGDGFPMIARNMAMFRGFGIKLWTVWQDVSQAERTYGRNWESFAANAGILQAFQPQDVATAEYLSQRTGLASHTTESFGLSGGRQNVGAGYQGMPLLLPQALRNIEPGFSVMFTHKTKGTVQTYMPFPELPPPSQAPQMKAAAPGLPETDRA